MPLDPGARLGPYEILGPLGAGGMGEVYTARDSRLHRDVAIKIAGEAFTDRFAREALAIAALNHTNICHLYDVGPDYLVMELVEGESPRGPLTFDEALPFIRQLIDGIEAAHERHIVHRDLKPANIKVTPDGILKILDFGLAKATDPEAARADPANSPTLAATQHGVIVGTSAYMAPEQARGRSADQRADIWAFGVIVYELLTGTKPFPGETTIEILGGVLNREPDLSAAPVRAQQLLRWCLEKDRKKRLQAIGDARRLLEEAPVANVMVARAPFRWLGWLAAAFTLVAGAGAAWIMKPAPDTPLMSFEISAPEGTTFGPVGSAPAAIVSPDGTQVVLVARGHDGQAMLWLRLLGSNTARVIPGTETAARPFWAGDGRVIGFFASGKLKRVGLDGGQPQVLGDAPAGNGSFTADGAVVFADFNRPLQIAAVGKPPATLFDLDRARGEIAQSSPQVLPDGRHVLYNSNAPPETSAMFASLDGATRRVLFASPASPAYYVRGGPKGTGWLLHVTGAGSVNRLVAHAFDPAKGEVTGEPILIADSVASGPIWSASNTGILMFRHARASSSRLNWLGRDGKPQGNVGGSGSVGDGRLSPDGKTIAYRRTVDGDANIWLTDLAGNGPRRLTFDTGGETDPAWSPDGQRVFYTASSQIVERPAGAIGAERIVVKGRPGAIFRATAVSPDGRWLAVRQSGTGQSQVVLVSIDDGRIVPVQESGPAVAARFSPDGRWLVYAAVIAGRQEVVIRTVPKDAGGPSSDTGKWQLSTAGGNQPVWRGKEIFYLGPGGSMMAAAVDTSGNEVRVVGTPTRLFTVDEGVSFDVTRDGQRFLVEQPVAGASDVPVTVIVNWHQLLRK